MGKYMDFVSDKIYKLKDEKYIEFFPSDSGYYYSIYNSNGMEIDGGLLEYGENEENQTLMNIRERLAEFTGYEELKDEDIEEISQEAFEEITNPKKEGNIRVISCEVNHIAEERYIVNELESLQREVDGYIEVLCLNDDVCLVCNEEGKIDNLPLNRAVRDNNGKIYEVIAGDFFICGQTPNGDFRSLTDKEFNQFIEIYKNPEQIMVINEQIIAIPITVQSHDELKEKITSRLYDELDDYKEKIVKLSNKEILERSYETATKEELPFRFEVMELDTKELEALDKYDGNLLSAFYDEWLDVDIQLNEVLEPAIERTVNWISKEYMEKNKDVLER